MPTTLDAAEAIYGPISDAMADLHQVTTGDIDAGDTGLPSEDKAEVSRNLLHAADLLERAASEVRRMYWQFRRMESEVNDR